jgi:hypothetical protein
MVWRLGNGKILRIDEDPWEGSTSVHKISEDLVLSLHNNGIFSLWNVRDQREDLTRHKIDFTDRFGSSR